MRVIVFGATGTVGRLAVAQLLDEGHEVTAFARRPECLDSLSHPKLRLAKGDALDRAAVAAVIEGQEAVVVTLGAGMSRKSRVRSQGTLNVIEGMHAHGVRRLICQSTLGAHESWSNLDFFWKRIMFGALLRPVFLDHEKQEELVRASGLDWTIVRPSAFTDDLQTGPAKVGFAPEERQLRLKITRHEVAAFLARQAGERAWLRRAVAISH